MVYRSKLIRSALMGAVTLSATSAFAADLDNNVYTDDANFVKPAELGSSWYLRGDVGVNIDALQDVTSNGSAAYGTFENNNLTDAITYSVGGGVKIGSHLRLEANIGRLAGSNFSTAELMTESAGDTDPTNLLVGSTEPISCNGRGEFVDVATGTTFIADDFIENCLRKDSVEYDTTYAMVNAYVDLPEVGGFQPFIGGGLGVGRVSWRQETGAIDCTPVDAELRFEGCHAYGTADQPAPNTPYEQPGLVDQGVGYRLGYQLAAGIAYNVSDNVTLDTTYKFTHYGDGDFNAKDGADLAAHGFSVHQVNVGMRYSFF